MLPRFNPGEKKEPGYKRHFMKVLTAAICDWLRLPVPLLNCKAIHSPMHGFISKVWDIWAEVKVSVKKKGKMYMLSYLESDPS